MNAKVKELLKLATDSLPTLGMANDVQNVQSGDRLRAHFEAVHLLYEQNDLLAMAEEAAAECPTAADEVYTLRESLANAVLEGGRLEYYRRAQEAIKALKVAAHQAPVESPDEIPVEHRSRPMNAADAARYHAGHRVSNPTVYLKSRYESGVLTSPIGSGQNRQWDVREFPEKVRDQMR